MTGSARILDGKAIAADVRSDVAAEVGRLSGQIGRSPALATVLVGDGTGTAVAGAGTCGSGGLLCGGGNRVVIDGP